MLAALFSKPVVEQRAALNDGGYWGTWQGDTSGTPVGVSSAMQLLAVAGCVRLITDSISTLPLDVFRERADGTKEEMTAPRWLKQPNVNLDTVGLIGQFMTSLLTAGNAYAVVVRDGTSLRSINPVDPTTVEVRRVQGRKAFFVQGKEFPGEMLHIPGLMLAGSDVGLSPLDYARCSINVGLEAQKFAHDQFEDFLNMPGVIEMPNTAQPDQMRAMAKAWKSLRSKKNRGLPGVLSGGATFKPTAISNEQAQFLQARQWTAAEIAAQVYMVDPSDLGIPVGGTTLTYANLEQRNIRRLQVTFLPWIVRLEKALSGLLPQPQYVKFNVDGLLRGDSVARWDVYTKAMQINVQAAQVGQPPVLETPEMRAFEDLNKLDEHVQPAPEPVTQPTDSTARDMNAAELIQKIYLGVGTVVTVEEAREIVAELSGHDLPGAPSELVPTQTMRSEARQEPPNVFVQNDVHVPAQEPPTVNVEPAGVVVDVQPVNVSVPGAEVRVTTPEAQTTVRRVERDADGRIARIIDEVV